jgi:hypothetical protein
MKRFIDWLRGKPSLRNKPGGMAWVQSDGLHSGAERLRNAAVKTLSVRENGMWRIEPPLGYIATHPQRFADGTLYAPGDVIVIGAIHDSALEPWKDTGLTESEVRDLYAPNLTTKETA